MGSKRRAGKPTDFESRQGGYLFRTQVPELRIAPKLKGPQWDGGLGFWGSGGWVVGYDIRD